jgi:hypothetical protein
MFSIGLKLTGEFTSLDEQTKVSDLAADAVFLPTDQNSLDPKGELSPETPCES